MVKKTITFKSKLPTAGGNRFRKKARPTIVKRGPEGLPGPPGGLGLPGPAGQFGPTGPTGSIPEAIASAQSDPFQNLGEKS